MHMVGIGGAGMSGLARLAAQAGYRVTKFYDPASALGAFRSHPDDYDLLFTDLAMPGMTGVDLAAEMRALRVMRNASVTRDDLPDGGGIRRAAGGLWRRRDRIAAGPVPHGGVRRRLGRPGADQHQCLDARLHLCRIAVDRRERGRPGRRRFRVRGRLAWPGRSDRGAHGPRRVADQCQRLTSAVRSVAASVLLTAVPVGVVLAADLVGHRTDAGAAGAAVGPLLPAFLVEAAGHVGAGLLRLADGLDRSHSQVIQGLRCRIDDAKVSPTFSPR